MHYENEPALVAAARAMVAGGQPWREVVPELQARARDDRKALADAAWHWADKLRFRRSGDFEALAVLRALETAVARTPVTERPR